MAACSAILAPRVSRRLDHKGRNCKRLLPRTPEPLPFNLSIWFPIKLPPPSLSPQYKSTKFPRISLYHFLFFLGISEVPKRPGSGGSAHNAGKFAPVNQNCAKQFLIYKHCKIFGISSAICMYSLFEDKYYIIVFIIHSLNMFDLHDSIVNILSYSNNSAITWL